MKSSKQENISSSKLNDVEASLGCFVNEEDDDGSVRSPSRSAVSVVVCGIALTMAVWLAGTAQGQSSKTAFMATMGATMMCRIFVGNAVDSGNKGWEEERETQILRHTTFIYGTNWDTLPCRVFDHCSTVFSGHKSRECEEWPTVSRRAQPQSLAVHHRQFLSS